jgi:hypothetical protein
MARAHAGAWQLWLTAVTLASSAACGTTVPLAETPDRAGLSPETAVATQAASDSGLSAPGPGSQGAVAGVANTPHGTQHQAPQQTEATAATAPGTPARDTHPIKIGILYTNNDAAGSAGVQTNGSFSLQKTFQGLVASWNKRGGLAGRRIVPTYVELTSSSPNLAADLARACTTFTQDAKVSAVLSVTGTYSDDFSRCMASTPVVTGDYALGDTTSMAASPSYFAPDALTTDRRVLSVLRHYVTKGDTVGVLVEGCSYNRRTYEKTMLPEAKRLGVTIKDHVETKCFQSINDLGAQSSDMQAAVLRFASDRVTKVLFVSGSGEGNLVLFFLTAAQAQGYHPHYAFSSAAGPVLQEGNTPKQQLAKAVVLGWLPSLDSAEFTQTPASTRCAADVRNGAGVSPHTPLDRLYETSACDVFTAYDAALQLTRGNAGTAPIRDALHRAGFASAAVLEGAVNLTGRQDGPSRARTVSWNSSCSCFRYSGGSFGI